MKNEKTQWGEPKGLWNNTSKQKKEGDNSCKVGFLRYHVPFLEGPGGGVDTKCEQTREKVVIHHPSKRGRVTRSLICGFNSTGVFFQGIGFQEGEA